MGFRSIFLETGILACVLLVIVAQLMPQIVAAKHPVDFLEFWIMRPGYYACIFLESTGITHITWVISHCLARIFGMKDEDEERNDYSRKLLRQETQDSAFSEETP